jgi:ACT domain-containing protein
MKQTIIFLVVILMTACDCVSRFEAVIVDAQTFEPLDSVMVVNINRSAIYTYSDENGVFEISFLSGGIKKCPPITVSIAKKGYLPRVLTSTEYHNDTIFLIKEQ